MRAKDIMNRDLLTISTTDSVRDAAKLMAEHNISGLPVVDEAGRLAGMISESDIIQQKRLFENLDFKRQSIVWSFLKGVSPWKKVR